MRFILGEAAFVDIVQGGGSGSVIVTQQDDLCEVVDYIRALLAQHHLTPQIAVSPRARIRGLLHVKAKGLADG